MLVIKDVCQGGIDKINSNPKKQAKKFDEEKVRKVLENQLKELEELQLSPRKKTIFTKSYRTFTELKVKKLNSDQLEIIDRAESIVDQWKNFEALLYEAELDNNINPKEFAVEARNKRATDQTCCKQVKITKSGTDENFPISHESYFTDFYILQADGANDYNLYRLNGDTTDKSVIKHCLNQLAWVVGKDKDDLDVCKGSFYIPSDENCIENVPTTGWKHTDDPNTPWLDTTLEIKIECYEEPEGMNLFFK